MNTLAKFGSDLAQIAKDTRELKTWIKSQQTQSEVPTIIVDEATLNPTITPQSPLVPSVDESFASVEEFMDNEEMHEVPLNL